jgi:methylmalonyl-CoA/ethylmalonyl-CoA epimerase
MKEDALKTPAKPSTLFGNHFAQVAWVVPDIEATAKYFSDTMGIPRFLKMENLNSRDLEGRYNGENANFQFHLYLALSGDSMLELIQPISGVSMYSDFLATHPEGGIQHIAYAVDESDFNEAVEHFTRANIPVFQSLVLPVAKVAYFDTYSKIGVATELIGLTESGHQLIEQLKSGNY